MGNIHLSNGFDPPDQNQTKQYESGGGEDRSASTKSGKDGSNMDKAMKKKYPEHKKRHKEHR